MIMDSGIKIVTHNANGLANSTKRRELLHYFHVKKYDLCFVQETHSIKSCEKVWSAEWGKKVWFSHGDSKSRGVGIFISKTLDCEVHNILSDDEGRFLILYTMWQQRKFLLVNVYAPNRDTPVFLQNLIKDIVRFSPDHTIIAGDFNLAVDPKIDRSGSIANNNNSAEILWNFTSQGYIDVWQHFHPQENGFTWRRLRPKPTFSRLDYIFVDEAFEQFIEKIVTIVTIPGYKSDHSTIRMQVQFQVSKRGPGYWKLNTSLLQDIDYVNKINQLLDIELEQESISYKSRWEIIKLTARGSSIQYSARKQKSKRNKLGILEKKLNQLTKEAENRNIIGLFQDMEEQIRQIRHEINLLHAEKTKGAKMRCKANWGLNAERPTRYFLRLEKQNNQCKTLHRLQTQDGRIVTDQFEILKEIRQYYDELYTTKGSINYEYLRENRIPTDHRRNEGFPRQTY